MSYVLLAEKTKKSQFDIQMHIFRSTPVGSYSIFVTPIDDDNSKN